MEVKAVEIKTLVRQWQDARLSCAPKREARLEKEIYGAVNEELEVIKQTPRNPKFESRFEDLYEALKPMAESWLRRELMEKAGIRPKGVNTFEDEKRGGK
jgi:hypothetical protein